MKFNLDQFGAKVAIYSIVAAMFILCLASLAGAIKLLVMAVSF